MIIEISFFCCRKYQVMYICVHHRKIQNMTMCAVHVKGVIIFLFLVPLSVLESRIQVVMLMSSIAVSIQHGAVTAMNKCTRVWQRLKTISISHMPCILEGQGQLQSVYLLVFMRPINQKILYQLSTHGVSLVCMSLFLLQFFNFYLLVPFLSHHGLRNLSYIFPSFVATFQKAGKGEKR